MTQSHRCPQCGADLPPDAPHGLCPKCVLQLGIGSQSASRPGAETTPYPGGATAPAPADIARHFPDLEVLELLGQGGMGAVYKARQKQLDRVVALKILPPQVSSDPAFAERFRREARSLGQLNHPNVVAVYDFGQRDGLYFFLMEYVDGVNLRDMIQGGHLNPQDALAIVPRICEALQYAHEEGIVHRDIKPENILVDKKGRVKIADFGLAKLLGKAPAATLTGAGQVMGTPHYMAPEQIERPLQVDHRADIYSLGVVFYEMLTGELPIGRFAPPSQKVQIDVRLDEVVLRALEKEPDRRFQQVSEVKTQVESICGVSALAMQRFGYEYRSKTTLFGLPLVHIATGFDPRTGR
jgi:serine/threonine protein kinase